YSHVIEESGSTERLRTCPQCRSPRFGDRDQVVPVLPLRHVSATVDPTRSAISDSSSERRIVPFSVLHTFAAEKTPDNIRQAWHLDNGFGAVSLRRATLRWLNLGWGAGPTVNVGSCEVKRPLFKVCRYCG